MATVNIENQILAAGAGIPPVHLWNPPLSGDIDIRIDREGRWYHDGELIKRESLVRLFASILWSEQGEYFLVTPVEKWRISVDEEPLLVIAANKSGSGATSRIEFETSTRDKFVLDHLHALHVDHAANGEPRPVVRVRYKLDALVHRNVFYQLIDWSEQVASGAVGVWSEGDFFPLSRDL